MKNFKLFFFAILPIVAVTAFSACNKDNNPDPVVTVIDITGTVTDQDGAALDGVAVASSNGQNATTAADGKYTITGVEKAGALTFTKDGYVAKTEFVNNRTSINVQLVTTAFTETTYEEVTFEKACDAGDMDITEVTVTDRGEGTGTLTWTKNKVYILNGFVFVNSGQTLTIEAGTVVKGASGQGERASALIVAQGGKLEAKGTADLPIIFTSESDELSRDVDGNLCLGTSLPASARGLWGGVIVLGKADITAATETRNIEGIPSTEPRGIYGGSDDADNSGTIEYVSIRHGGTDIGAGNEINGLTMGGVGNGTTINYVEVFSNKDDGYEWFGGTVNTKHLVSAYCGDDCFDYDEGWRGKNQFWLAYQADDTGDRGGEHDGGPSDCETCEPYATPMIYNVSSRGNGNGRAITFRDNAGGEYHNSIFWNWQRGVDIEVRASIADSYDQFVAGRLKFTDNILFQIPDRWMTIGNEDSGDVTAEQAALDAYFNDAANNIKVEDPQLNADLSPVAGGPAASATLAAPSDGFFENAPYKGAFAPGVDTWIQGWTRIADEL
ncbi:MAG: carboxypeptidase regulatory-like domain-containing protein [Phaeodactylibacter sp.]|nr:carboxypeptidase regulatory-like domain-containing protein [Phaeodactylibacter sp.]MCB9300834.1 carboxypeptidase regulatory-like domain-containing protein [Lewinellaceae bacterium]